nr:NADH dehydrogenase subunit 1 [Antarctophthirus lobodontis]
MSLFVVLVELVLSLLCVMLSVAYFSLFERKLLGIVHYRLGPSKVGMVGMFQPFSDAIKLGSKSISFPNWSKGSLYVVGAFMMMIVHLMCWVVFPFEYSEVGLDYSGLVVLLLLSVSIYGVLFTGWFANSKYTIMGAVRSVSLAMAFEIPQAMCLFCSFLAVQSVCLWEVMKFQMGVWLGVPLVMVLVVFFCCCIAESGRSPFDVGESESELVSGYTTEYGGMSYVVVFLSENMSVLFGSALINILFLGDLNPLKITLTVSLMVIVRSVVPRLRFDAIMSLCWFSVVPTTVVLVWMSAVCL